MKFLLSIAVVILALCCTRSRPAIAQATGRSDEPASEVPTPLQRRSELTILSLTSTPAVTRQEVTATRSGLDAVIPGFRNCHDRAMQAGTDIVGIVRVRFGIAQGGRVNSCRVTQTVSDVVAACICGRVRSHVFTQREGALNELDLELRLSTRARAAPLNAPGCGEIRDPMPSAVRSVASAIARRRCLGPRGALAFRRGTLEVWLDSEASSPSPFLAMGGGVAAFRSAGIARIRVIASGGRSGEFMVLPVRTLMVE